MDDSGPTPVADPDERPYPQEGRRRMIMPHPIAFIGQGPSNIEHELLAQMGPEAVFMMGDNPALPRMPEKPKLLDFFRLRFGDITFTHLLTSAKKALDEGQDEKVIIACLLHDISNGCLVRADHGYWGSQMIAPYVSEEVAWAVKYHQPLRYFADESVGYEYPESYKKFFGPDYVPPEYIQKDAEAARAHRWYMTSRLVTLYDIYFFEQSEPVDP
jgi:hypothetical protein